MKTEILQACAIFCLIIFILAAWVRSSWEKSAAKNNWLLPLGVGCLQMVLSLLAIGAVGLLARWAPVHPALKLLLLFIGLLLVPAIFFYVLTIATQKFEKRLKQKSAIPCVVSQLLTVLVVALGAMTWVRGA